MTNGKVKSPWRLRFEKFLNHQELTPLSPTNESIAFTTVKVKIEILFIENSFAFSRLHH
jgi:hypothetical protein